jgi:hypothetical protein
LRVQAHVLLYNQLLVALHSLYITCLHDRLQLCPIQSGWLAAAAGGGDH